MKIIRNTKIVISNLKIIIVINVRYEEINI